MEVEPVSRFGPVDIELLHIRSKLSPGQRILAMLDARELLVGLICGRLRQQYLHLAAKKINLKVLEEIDRAQQIRPDLSLFLDILRQLEEIGVPYVIIGGFAATV